MLGYYNNKQIYKILKMKYTDDDGDSVYITFEEKRIEIRERYQSFGKECLGKLKTNHFRNFLQSKLDYIIYSHNLHDIKQGIDEYFKKLLRIETYILNKMKDKRSFDIFIENYDTLVADYYSELNGSLFTIKDILVLYEGELSFTIDVQTGTSTCKTNDCSFKFDCKSGKPLEYSLIGFNYCGEYNIENMMSKSYKVNE